MNAQPRPYTWTCERCGQSIEAWDLNTRPWDAFDENGQLFPQDKRPRSATYRPLSIDCLMPLVPPAGVQEAHFRYQLLDRSRTLIGNPPGTLLGSQGRIGNAFQVYWTAVGVDAWDTSRPQVQVLPGPDSPPWWPPVIVNLGALVATSLTDAGLFQFAATSKAPTWQFTWSWEQPQEQATCLLHNWDTPLTKDDERRVMHARNAFIRVAIRRGRRSGSGARFETREDFEQSIRAAASALNKRGRPVTKAAVGRYIVAQGPRNRTLRAIEGKTPADPGRQVSAWCKKFAVDFEETISGL